MTISVMSDMARFVNLVGSEYVGVIDRLIHRIGG